MNPQQVLFCQQTHHHTATQTAPHHHCWMSSDRETEQTKLLATTSMTMFAYLHLTLLSRPIISHAAMDNLLLLNSTPPLTELTKAPSVLAWEPLN
jgi:hypothetical protein